jgi:hypothetical protein
MKTTHDTLVSALDAYRKNYESFTLEHHQEILKHACFVVDVDDAYFVLRTSKGFASVICERRLDEMRRPFCAAVCMIHHHLTLSEAAMECLCAYANDSGGADSCLRATQSIVKIKNAYACE